MGTLSTQTCGGICKWHVLFPEHLANILNGGVFLHASLLLHFDYNFVVVFLILQAVNNSGLELPDTVENIMNTWVLQMGFPVVTINTVNGVVSQDHFLLDPESEVTTPSPYKYVQGQKNDLILITLKNTFFVFV